MKNHMQTIQEAQKTFEIRFEIGDEEEIEEKRDQQEVLNSLKELLAIMLFESNADEATQDKAIEVFCKALFNTSFFSKGVQYRFVETVEKLAEELVNDIDHTEIENQSEDFEEYDRRCKERERARLWQKAEKLSKMFKDFMNDLKNNG